MSARTISQGPAKRGGDSSHRSPPLTSGSCSGGNLSEAEGVNASGSNKFLPAPSTFELARASNGLWKQINEQDEIRTHAKAGSQEYAASDAAYSRLYHQVQALNDLIFVSPVTSIEDALAVAVHGCAWAEGADCREDNEVMKRAFARLAIFLSETAQIDLEQLGSGNSAKIIRNSANLMDGSVV
jgi:hypothetical protein